MWVAGFLALLLLLVECKGHGDFGPSYEYLYGAWAQELYQHRDTDFTWKDGSGWTDGVSHIMPALPLASGARVSGAMTCAQEEVLRMVAFPMDERPDEWLLKPDAPGITLEWDTNFAAMVWGEQREDLKPGALIWLKREPFLQRCGVIENRRSPGTMTRTFGLAYVLAPQS